MAESLEVQLDRLWEDEVDVVVLPTRGNRYVIISDMHMGNGEEADDFRKNKDAAVRALNYYRDEGYSLILLGDIEELWQFTPDEVVEEYGDSVYESIRAFDSRKVFRVFGNHDIDWKNTDPIRPKSDVLYDVYEGIKLNDTNGEPKILLVHGHQGTADSDKNSFISRAGVMVYRYVERFVKFDHATSAPRSIITQDFEKERFDWAMRKNVIIICGHTHRAVFKSENKIDILEKQKEELMDQLMVNADIFSDERIQTGDNIKRIEKEINHEMELHRYFESLGRNPTPHYFNTGCALYTDGITVIEIASNMIKLVKWHREVSGGDLFSIYRQGNLSEIIGELG